MVLRNAGLTNCFQAVEEHCPMGTVPVLNVGSVVIPQSKAIERFVARRLGLLGIDSFEEALVDSICELIRDLELAILTDESRHFINRHQQIHFASHYFLQILGPCSAQRFVDHQPIYFTCLWRFLRRMLTFPRGHQSVSVSQSVDLSSSRWRMACPAAGVVSSIPPRCHPNFQGRDGARNSGLDAKDALNTRALHPLRVN